ncbi:hypothetical protein [Arthrobacter pityocampae]|uniref:hypothetical protein n=1 Tax=Arthrobacter pityocampae TaxID=547334 RepID=UPI0037369F82
MAYVRGARRHPMFVLTITPEMEEQIEKDIEQAKRDIEAKLKAVKASKPRTPRRDTQPCGTTAGYYRHLRKREPMDDACRTAGLAHRAARRAGIKPKRKLSPCGTYAAYRRHVEHGEQVDDACEKAKTQHHAERYVERMARREMELAA